MIIFGEFNSWGIDYDDGCLLFIPDIEKPNVYATHIWREVWEEVQRRGGYDKVIEELRAMIMADQEFTAKPKLVSY